MPTSAVLGSGAPGTTIGPTALGAVTVTDNRALLLASLDRNGLLDQLRHRRGSAAETIPVADATYTTGTATRTGVVVVTPVPTLTLAVASQTVVTGAGVGNNSAAWNPTVAIAVPAAAVTGLYTGTISHSVA